MGIGINDYYLNAPAVKTGQDVLPGQSDGDYVDKFLELQGIDDKSNIKFEDENGEITNVNWDDLTDNEKVNIMISSVSNTPSDEELLDNDEILLINAIRSLSMTPVQYINTAVLNGINRYIDNSRFAQGGFSVDLYDDDELYLADLVSRTNDITEDEAQESLRTAKSNPDLYKKQIKSLRQEYKTIEQENLKLNQLEWQQIYNQQFRQFSDNVINQINNFTDFSGYDLNLNNEDKQLLYDFVVGHDAAGMNHFAKALQDPQTLVLSAWLALNGGKMIDDITSYYNKEIGKVREYSYRKGLADARAGQLRVVYKNKSNLSFSSLDSELDDF